MSAISSSSSDPHLIGLGGLHIPHPVNTYLNQEQEDHPTSGVLDYLRPLWFPSTGTIGGAATAATTVATTVLTNMADLIMFRVTTQAAVSAGASYGIPATLSTWAAGVGMAAGGIPALPPALVAATGFVAGHLMILAGNAAYSAYNNGKAESAKNLVNDLMERLADYDSIDIPNFKAECDAVLSRHETVLANMNGFLKRKMDDVTTERAKEPPNQSRIAALDIEISDLRKNISDEIENFKNSMLAFDKKFAERDAVELSLIGSLEGMYQAMKKNKFKLGDVTKELGIEELKTISAEDARREMKHHLVQSKNAGSPEAKEQHTVMANYFKDMFLRHLKFRVAERVFRD